MNIMLGPPNYFVLWMLLTFYTLCNYVSGQVDYERILLLSGPSRESTTNATFTDPTAVVNGAVRGSLESFYRDQFGQSLALSNQALRLVVGAPFATVTSPSTAIPILACGAVYVYERAGIAWRAPVRLLAPPEPSASEAFGSSVAIDGAGTVIIVGAEAPALQGRFYTFVLRTNALRQKFWVANGGAILAPSTPGTDDHFGSALSMSQDGQWLVIGAYRWRVANQGVDAAKGAAFVFKRRDNSLGGLPWQWAGNALVDPEGSPLDSFGERVAISPDGLVIAVGSLLKSIGAARVAGSVFLYVRNEGSDVFEFAQEIQGTQAYAVFGSSLSFYHDATRPYRLAIGARLQSVQNVLSAGVAFVYQKTGTTWANMMPVGDPAIFHSDAGFVTSRRLEERFGNAVVLQKDVLFVGMYNAAYRDAGNNSASPPVRAFVWNGATWKQDESQNPTEGRDELSQLGYKPNDGKFGSALAVAGDWMAVGAPFDEAPGAGKSVTALADTPGYVYTYIAADRACNGYGYKTGSACTCNAGNVNGGTVAQPQTCLACDTAQGYYGDLSNLGQCQSCNGHGNVVPPQGAGNATCLCDRGWTNSKDGTKCGVCLPGFTLPYCFGVLQLFITPPNGIVFQTKFWANLVSEDITAINNNVIQWEGVKYKWKYFEPPLEGEIGSNRTVSLDTTTTPTRQIEDLPKGTVRVVVEMWRSIDGADLQVGAASATVVITAGSQASNLTLNRTQNLIDKLDSRTTALNKIQRTIVLVNSLGEADITAADMRKFRAGIATSMRKSLFGNVTEDTPDTVVPPLVTDMKNWTQEELGLLRTVMLSLIAPGKIDNDTFYMTRDFFNLILNAVSPALSPPTTQLFAIAEALHASLLILINEGVIAAQQMSAPAVPSAPPGIAPAVPTPPLPPSQSATSTGVTDAATIAMAQRVVEVYRWYATIATKEMNFTGLRSHQWDGNSTDTHLRALRITVGADGDTSERPVGYTHPTIGLAEVRVVAARLVSGNATEAFVHALFTTSNPLRLSPQSFGQTAVSVRVRIVAYTETGAEITQLASTGLRYRLEFSDSYLPSSPAHCTLYAVRRSNFSTFANHIPSWDSIARRDETQPDQWEETLAQPQCPEPDFLPYGEMTAQRSKFKGTETRPVVSFRSTSLVDHGVFMQQGIIPTVKRQNRRKAQAIKWDKTVFLTMGFGCWWALSAIVAAWGYKRDQRQENRHAQDLAANMDPEMRYSGWRGAVLELIALHAWFGIVWRRPGDYFDTPKRVFKLSCAAVPMSAIAVFMMPWTTTQTSTLDILKAGLVSALVSPPMSLMIHLLFRITTQRPFGDSIRKRQDLLNVVASASAEEIDLDWKGRALSNVKTTWVEQIETATGGFSPHIVLDPQGELEAQRGGVNPYVLVAQAERKRVQMLKLSYARTNLRVFRDPRKAAEQHRKAQQPIAGLGIVVEEKDADGSPTTRSPPAIHHNNENGREDAERETEADEGNHGGGEDTEEAPKTEMSNTDSQIPEIVAASGVRLPHYVEVAAARPLYVRIVGRVVEAVVLAVAVVVPLALGYEWYHALFGGASVGWLALCGVVLVRDKARLATLMVFAWAAIFLSLWMCSLYKLPAVRGVPALALAVVWGGGAFAFCDRVLRRPFVAMTVFSVLHAITLYVVLLIGLQDRQDDGAGWKPVIPVGIYLLVSALVILRLRYFVKDRLLPLLVPSWAQWQPWILGGLIQASFIIGMAVHSGKQENYFGKVFYTYAILIGACFHCVVLETLAVLLLFGARWAGAKMWRSRVGSWGRFVAYALSAAFHGW